MAGVLADCVPPSGVGAADGDGQAQRGAVGRPGDEGEDERSPLHRKVRRS